MPKLNFWKILFFIGACVFSLFVFTTCENAGLGLAVDVMPPAVQVTAPTTKSVISGPFTVQGICSDDIGVNSVKVEFRRLVSSSVSSEVAYSYTANLQDDNWNVALNQSPSRATLPASFEIADGDYQITVTAYDGGGHETSCDVTYTVDNTPPTVLLTSPNDYSITPEALNEITIKGEVYDMTNLQKVEVFIADANGNTLAQKVAEGTNSFLAKFEKEELSQLKNNTLYFYYAVATDAGGNTNSYDFHKSDIYSLISTLSDKTFPSVNSLGSLDQYLSTELPSGLTREKLLEKKLDIAKKGVEETKYPDLKYYTESPDKVQWLNVANEAFLASEGGEGTPIGVGVSVFGTIKPPADESSVTGATVWVQKCSSVVADIPQFDDFTNADKISSSFNKDDKDNVQALFTVVGSSVNFEIKSKKPNDVSATNWASTYWRVKIEYTTSSGLRESSVARFEVSSEVPLLKETCFGGSTSPTYFRGYMNKATKDASKNKFVIAVSASDAVTPVDSLLLKYKDKSGIDKNEVLIDSTKNTGALNIERIFSYDTSGSGIDDCEIEYTLIASKTGVKATIARTVVIDTVKPKINVTNLSDNQILQESELQNESGIFSYIVRGNIEDTNAIAKTEYKLAVDGVVVDEATNGGWKESASSSKIEIDIKNLVSEGLKELKTYTLYLRAVDAAGNATGDNDNKYRFTIDLAKPVATITEPEAYKGGQYALVQNPPLVKGFANDAAVTNGKAATKATLSYRLDDATDEIPIPAGSGINDFKWSANTGSTKSDMGAWSWQMPTSVGGKALEGMYRVTLTVTDADGRTQTAERTIKLDKKPPTIKFISVTPNMEQNSKNYVNGKVSLRFDVEDDDKLDKVLYYVGNNPATMTAATMTHDINGTTNIFQLVIPEIDTRTLNDSTALNNCIKIVARDRSGNETIFADSTVASDAKLSGYTILQSTDNPRINVNGFKTNITSASSITKENNMTTSNGSLNITVDDDDGVKEIKYQFDGGTEHTIDGNDGKSQSFSISLSGQSEGAHRIKVTASDTVQSPYHTAQNNESDTGTFYFGIDDTYPTLKFTKINDVADSLFNDESTRDYNVGFKNADVKLTGLASDTYEFKNLILKIYEDNSANPTTETASGKSITVDGTSHEWNETIAKPTASHAYKYEFTATDKFLKTTVKTFSLVFDLDKPAITVTSAPPLFFNQNQVVTATGKANDTVISSKTYLSSGLQKVQYALGTGHNATSPDSKGWQNTNGTSDWTLLGNFDYVKTDGNYTLMIESLDNNGNESSIVKYNVTLDSVVPVLKEGNPLSTETQATTYANNTIMLTGEVSDLNIDRAKCITYTCKKDGAEVPGEVDKAISVTAKPGETNVYTWQITKDISRDTGNSSYVYEIKASDKAGNSSNLTRTIQIDKTDPLINMNSVTPVRIIAGDKTVNGNIEVNVTVTDETKLQAAYYTYGTGSDCWTVGTLSSGQAVAFSDNEKVGGIKITVPTTQDYTHTKLGSKDVLALKIKAIDQAGNETVKDFTAYIVDQESDRPTFAPTNFESLASLDKAGVASKDGTAAASENNIFDKNSGKLFIDLADDDGLKNISVKIDNGAWSDLGAISASSTTASQYQYPVKNLSYGRHSLQFKVTDINYSDDTATPYNFTESSVYYIAVDDSLPVLNVTTQLDQYFNSQFEITGVTSDEGNVTKLEFISKDTNDNDFVFYEILPGSGAQTVGDAKGNWSLTYDVNAKNAGHTKKPSAITIRATDGIGRQRESQFTYKYDNIPPLLKIDDTAASKFLRYNLEGYVASPKNTSYVFGTYCDPQSDGVFCNPGDAGYATHGDGTSSSGVAKIQWAVVRGKNQPTSAFEGASWTDAVMDMVVDPTDDKYNDVPKRYGWVIKYSQPEMDDGDLTFIVRAIDKVGNVSNIERQFYTAAETAGVTNPNTGYDDNMHPFTGKTAFAVNNFGCAKPYNTNFNIVADSTSPTLTATSSDGTAKSDENDTLYLTQNVSLSGTVTDINTLDNGTVTGPNFVPSYPNAAVTVPSDFTTVLKALVPAQYQSAFPVPTPLKVLTTMMYGDATNIFTAMGKAQAMAQAGNPVNYLDLMPEVGFTVTVNDGTTSADYSTPQNLTVDYQAGTWDWHKNFDSDGTYDVTIYTKDLGYYYKQPNLNCATVKRRLVIDTTDPKITIKSVSPVVTEGSGNAQTQKVNGKNLKVEATVFDANIEGAWYTYDYNADDTKRDWTNATAFSATELVNGISLTVDTTDSSHYRTEGGVNYLTLCIMAKDKSGNATYEKLNYIVDQESDRPTFTPTNFYDIPGATSKDNAAFVYTDANGKQQERNIFDSTGGTLYIDLTDDDGLKEISVKVDGASSWTKLGDITGTTLTYKYSIKDAALSYGRHSIQFKVMDKNYTDDTATAYNVKTSSVYYIAVDDGAPTLNVTTQSDNFVASTFDISGYTSDENNVKKLEFISKNASDEDVPFYTIHPASGTETVTRDWTQTYDVTTDSKKVAPITIRATDGIGRVREAQFTYKYDNVSPVLKIDDTAASKFLRYNLEGYIGSPKNTSYIFGSYEDPTEPGSTVALTSSGVEKIEWIVVPGHGYDISTLTDENWQKAENAKMNFTVNPASGYAESAAPGKWYIAYARAEMTDGPYTFIIRAKDKVGNYSDITRQFYQKGESAGFDNPNNINPQFTNKDDSINPATGADASAKPGNTNYNIVSDGTSPILAATSSKPADSTHSSPYYPTEDIADTLYTTRAVTLSGYFIEPNPICVPHLDASTMSLVFDQATTAFLEQTLQGAGFEVLVDGVNMAYTPDTTNPLGCIPNFTLDYSEYATLSQTGMSVNSTPKIKWTWSHTFTDDGTHTIVIKVRDRAYWHDVPSQNCGTVTRNIVIDTTSPTVNVTAVTPTVTSGSDKKVNGKNLEVKAIAADANLEGAWYTYDYDADDASRDWANATAFTSSDLVNGITLSVDTTASTNYHADSDGKNRLNLCFKVVDKSGNTTYLNLGDYIVDQTTDKPQFVNPNLVELNSQDEAGFVEATGARNNVFGKTENNTINVTLSEDDGLKEISVQVDDTPAVTTPLSATSMPWNYSVRDLDYGRHSITFTLKDKWEGGTFDNGDNSKLEKTYFIAIDDGAPTLTVDAISSYGNFVKGTFKIKGTAKDENTITKIVIKESDSGNTQGATQELTATNGVGTWTGGADHTVTWESADFTLNTESGTISVTVYDGINNSNAKVLNFTKDTVAPTLTLNDDSQGPFFIGEVTNEKLTGSATDATSGIDEVRYFIDGNATVQESDLAKFSSKDDSIQASYTQQGDVVTLTADFSGKSGKQYVHIAAKDKAGNLSSVTTVEVSIDAQVPQTTVTPENGTFSDETVISGTATDDLALQSIEVKFYGENAALFTYDFVTGTKGGTASTTMGSTAGNVTSANWNFTLPATVTEGANRELVFTVIDKSGKKTSVTKTYTIDRTPPTITFPEIEGTDGATKFNATTSKFRFNVNYTDDTSGVDTVTYKFERSTDGGVTFVDANLTGSEGTVQKGDKTNNAGSRSGSVTLEMPFLSGPQSQTSVTDIIDTTDGLWKVEITATDMAGKSATLLSNSFWIDQNKPYLVYDEPGQLKSKGDSVKYKGSISDNNYGEIDKLEISMTHPEYTPTEKTKFTITLQPGQDSYPYGSTFAWNATNKTYEFEWRPGAEEGDNGTTTEENSPYKYNGNYIATVRVYDKAGNEKEQTIRTTCDNTPPTMQLTRPYTMNFDDKSAHDALPSPIKNSTGTETIAGRIPNEDSMDAIYYQIHKAGTVTITAKSDTDTTETTYTAEQYFTSGLSTGQKITSISIASDGALTEGVEEVTSGKLSGKWKKAADKWNWSFDVRTINIASEDFATNRDTTGATTNLWLSYVYVVAKDSAGNLNLGVFPLYIDSDFDKPMITISSPDPNASDNLMGGAFSVTGVATDDYQVSKVYMQVEVVHGNYVNGVLTARSGTPSASVNGGVFPGEAVTRTGTDTTLRDAAGTTGINYFTKIGDVATNPGAWYEVDGVTGTQSSDTWKLKINNQVTDGKRIFDNAALADYYTQEWATNGYDAANQTELIIRILAKDAKPAGDKKPSVFGEVKEVHVKIDSGAPSIDFENFPLADSYVKSGEIPFKIVISDDGTVDSYSIVAKSTNGTRTCTIVPDTQGAGAQTVTIEKTGGTAVTAEDLMASCGNKITVTVEATDDAGKKTTATRNFFIDISAPTFEKAKVAGKTQNTYLYNEAPDGFGERDTDGYMRIATASSTINGYMKEESGGSGIKSAILFFTDETDTNVFSVGGTSSSVSARDDTGTPMTHTISVIEASASNQNVGTKTINVPFESIEKVDTNENGIKYVGGKDVEKDVISSGTRTPYIVIDLPEGGSDSGVNGDHDGYNENMSALGVWYIEFDSNLIKDGKYHVNYLIVDQAGNVRFYQDKMFVQNNKPLVNSITFNTDMLGTSSLRADDEVKYIPKKDGSAQEQDYAIDGSDLTDKTVFKSRNYKTSIKLNVTGENVDATHDLVYKITFTKGGTPTTVSSADSPMKQGVTWDATNKTFTFSGATCVALAESGTMEYTLEVLDNLGLSSGASTFKIEMENVDKTAPHAQMFEFNTDSYASMADGDWKQYVASKTDAQKNRGTFDKAQGHIEPRGAIATNNTRPTLSGKVYIRGEALDEQRINKVELQVAGGTNVTLATRNGTTGELEAQANVELHQVLDQRGHYIEFAYLWDSSSIQNIAQNNVTLKLVVTDGGSNANSTDNYSSATNTPKSSSAMFDSKTGWGYNATAVDIAPYITSIDTHISKKAGKYVARSATGKYVVYEKETITVHGFNLAGTQGTSFKLGNVALTNSGTSSGRTESVDVTISNSAITGDLVATVNGVTSINNLNQNPVFAAWNDNTITANAQNSMANGRSNDRLTDDMSLYVWEMGENFVSETNITSPMLKIDASSNFYMSYGYHVPSMYVNKNGTTRQIDYSYNKFHNTNVLYDGNGNLYAVAMNTDRVNNSSARFVFYTPYSNTQTNQMPATDSNPDSYDYSYSSTSKRHLETAYNSATTVYDINRVSKPKMASYTSGSKTYIGIAYYDANNTINPVKVRFGTRNGQTISGGIQGSISDYNQYSSRYPTMSESNDPTKTDSSYKDYHIVASTDTDKKGGSYAACGIVPKGNGYVGVVAWYDADTTRLCYSYNENPDSPVVGGVWQTNAKYLDEEGTGWYVDMTVDGNNGIHIAYYNSNSGDLKYVYLSSYNATPSEPITVDSYNSVGSNITINTRLEGENYVPYIYYYNSSSNETPFSIKVAWRTNMTGSLQDGAIDEKFTGTWESMIVPNTNVPVSATVCGGVPTTNSGDRNWAGQVVLGYMTNRAYERAVLKLH